MKPPKLSTKSENQREWWSREGLLYFISAGEPTVAVKIGVTSIKPGETKNSSLRKRLKSVQSCNHEPVRIIGLIHFREGEMPMGDAETRERQLHIAFANAQRFKQHTIGAEWFHPVPELLELIENEAKFDLDDETMISVCTHIKPA